MFITRRSEHNPIIQPLNNHPWESFGAFNWCTIKKNNEYVTVYRAMSEAELYEGATFPHSIIANGVSSDGIHFRKRKKFIVPEYEWERFGCEDPRITHFEGKYYIFYTALSVYPFATHGIKVAVAVTKTMNAIDEKHLVTPFNAKAMSLFPERIGKKICVIFSAHTDMPPAKIAIACCDYEEELWSSAFWETWHKELDYRVINLKRNEDDHVEVGAPPVKTKHGWLLVYSHIQHYGKSNQVFGIEAVLLDLQNPLHILRRTRGPLLVPEEEYEINGKVPRVVFPSGALIHGDMLCIYYGSADTTCSLCEIRLRDLLDSMEPNVKKYVLRLEKNPILSPKEGHPWEAKAVFNPAAIVLKNAVHILYRAMSHNNTSVIGYAKSEDGTVISERLQHPAYTPRENFEMKQGDPNGNSGAEDPRITAIDGTLYMFYTAYNGVALPQVAVTSIEIHDFLKQEWRWRNSELISPLGVDDKDACLHPERVADGFLIFHRIGPDICADYAESLHFEKEKLTKCIKVMSPRPGMWDSKRIGIAAPPIKTKKGWLLFYHGISEDGTYKVGIALLDKSDPTVVIGRTSDWILEPEMLYEREGQVANVVFPCGVVLFKRNIFIYYGGGDSVVCAALMKLSDVLKALT